jgi:carbonic anhydrase/acetyltransferase-like protein (isoleucine patch superfamily)
MKSQQIEITFIFTDRIGKKSLVGVRATLPDSPKIPTNPYVLGSEAMPLKQPSYFRP